MVKNSLVQNFICKQCTKYFSARLSPSRKNRNIYCSVDCKKHAQRKIFKDSNFHLENYAFFIPEDVGNYEKLHLGKREKQFVNKNKADHFFFQHGIHDERTAYILGIFLTDGSIGTSNHGSKYVRLQMTDKDIVEDVYKALNIKTKLQYSISRNAYSFSIASPYLHHDLTSLGCVENKTQVINYPFIPKELDKHLIRGIIDGDGSWWITKEGICLMAICGNNLLLNGIYLTIRNHLNIRAFTTLMINDNLRLKCALSV